MFEIVVLFKEDDKFDESAALANLIETYGQVKEAVTLTESGQKKRKGVDKDAEGATVTTSDDKDEKDEKVKKVKASEIVAVRFHYFLSDRLNFDDADPTLSLPL
jgi:hypothetical protein